jgi:hypothetical protein
MEYKDFFEAMFTLVDLWTLTLNGEEYGMRYSLWEFETCC